MKNVTRNEIAKVLDCDLTDDPSKISRSRDGLFTFRREYFWRPKRPPAESFVAQLEKLSAAFSISDVDYGDIFQSFKGGRGVKWNSHFYMTFRATRKAA